VTAATCRNRCGGHVVQPFTTANFGHPKSGVGYQVQVQVPIQRMNSLEEVRNIPILATRDRKSSCATCDVTTAACSRVRPLQHAAMLRWGERCRGLGAPPTGYGSAKKVGTPRGSDRHGARQVTRCARCSRPSTAAVAVGVIFCSGG